MIGIVCPRSELAVSHEPFPLWAAQTDSESDAASLHLAAAGSRSVLQRLPSSAPPAAEAADSALVLHAAAPRPAGHAQQPAAAAAAPHARPAAALRPTKPQPLPLRNRLGSHWSVANGHWNRITVIRFQCERTDLKPVMLLGLIFSDSTFPIRLILCRLTC